ncbi:MAG: CDP-diacylglycerol--serine O-phosphatidyltransferase [Euryarchaeota archaeon]|nr:CDP-diacylglycerol--serine O-phosphatidyltransferase [Euryarchaeota archaeon]
MRLKNHFADALTLLNGLAGFFAIITLFIETGYFTAIRDDIVATAFIGIGLAFDGLDGIVARRFGSTRIGKQLDSLSDLITFVVAPALFIIYAYGAEAWYSAILVALLVLVFGMLRLARFNATDEPEAKTFSGLPTPWCAVSICLLVLSPIPRPVSLAVISLLALLMVSNIAYPKSRDRITGVALGIIVVAVAFALSLLFYPRYTDVVLILASSLTALIVAAGPIVSMQLQRRGQ